MIPPIQRSFFSIIQETFSLSKSKQAFASSIQKTPQESLLSSFTNKKKKLIEPKSIEHLTISEEHQKVLHLLIEDLATKSIFQLAYNALKLKEIGETLKNAVHPYRFLLEIFSRPSSKEHLQKIYEQKNDLLTGQIWKDFVVNFEKNFEDRIGDIGVYTHSFAKAFNLDPLIVAFHEQTKDWEGLIIKLLNDQSH